MPQGEISDISLNLWRARAGGPVPTPSTTPASARGRRDAPQTAQGAPEDRDLGSVYFSQYPRDVFPGLGFVFLKSQAAKNSRVLARPRCPGVNPCVEPTFSTAAPAAPAPGAASCAALFKEPLLPLVCLKNHLVGKTGFFFLAGRATWPQIIPRWMIWGRIE